MAQLHPGYQLLIAVVLSFLSIGTAQYPEGCACPDECVCSTRTGTIDCTSQEITYVPREINSCEWHEIWKVDLSGNAITDVPALAFSQMRNITHLYLYDNEIQTIHSDAFVGLQSLENLFLDGNRISELHSTVFRPLGRLKKLLLYSNRIASLPVGIFAKQSALSRLALHGNRLSSLQPQVFDDLQSLEELYLHDNQLTSLSIAPFRSLRRLTRLFLSNNNLTRLTRFNFLGLSGLRSLVVNSNGLSTVERDTFLPVYNLQELYLDHNQLTEINRLTFAPLVKLVHLQVVNNEVASISDGSFFRQRELQRLFLYGNRISTVSTQTFVGLDSLRELVLYRNRISQIVNNTFVQSPLMQRLWLYSNQISCLESAAFRGLGNLQILQLADNELSYLPEDIFQPTRNLYYLLLDRNRFRAITNRPFRNLPRLVQLSLFYNSIEYIAEGALNGTDQLYYFQWNEVTDFTQDNALVCDCSSLWLWQWMVAHRLQSTVLCSSPEQFRGQEIRALQQASFGCNSISQSLEMGPHCDHHVVKRGGCLRLSCVSNPRAPVTWTRVDGREISPVPHSCDSPGSCGTDREENGVLVVENIQPEEAGYYMCTSTIQNSTTSGVCRVEVGEAPVLLADLEEVILTNPGPLARFSLNFTGTPTPNVTWYHNSSRSGKELVVKEDGPNSRFLVSQSGMLVILETRVEDEGVYRAVVSNGAGEVHTQAVLEFYFSSACRRDCMNGGSCSAFHVCVCSKNYAGRQCETYTGQPTTEPPTDGYDPYSSADYESGTPPEDDTTEPNTASSIATSDLPVTTSDSTQPTSTQPTSTQPTTQSTAPSITPSQSISDTTAPTSQTTGPSSENIEPSIVTDQPPELSTTTSNSTQPTTQSTAPITPSQSTTAPTSQTTGPSSENIEPSIVTDQPELSTTTSDSTQPTTQSTITPSQSISDTTAPTSQTTGPSNENAEPLIVTDQPPELSTTTSTEPTSEATATSQATEPFLPTSSSGSGDGEEGTEEMGEGTEEMEEEDGPVDDEDYGGGGNAVKGYVRRRRKRATYTGLHSQSSSIQRSSDFQKVLRDLVREEEEFEIKLQQAREFARLRKEQERMQRHRATPQEVKARQQSVHGQHTQVLSRKLIRSVHLQTGSEKWIVKHSEPSSSSRGHNYHPLQSNYDLQSQIEEHPMNHKLVLPTLQDSFIKEQFVFKEGDFPPLPTSEQLHQDGHEP